MEKIFILSTDTYLDLDYDDREVISDIIKENCSNNRICFVSREDDRFRVIKRDFKNVKNIYYKSRIQINSILEKNEDKKNYFVVLGSKNVDFRLAVNNKLLYLVPLWNKIKENKALKYGVKVDNLDMLNEIIKALNNQNEWYYELELPDRTKIYSLISAQSYSRYIPADEKRVVEGFENYLKRGNGTYYKVLLCHFLAFMSNNSDFRDIDCWGIMPSSGLELNDYMYEFKEIVRFFMKGQVPRGLTNTPEKNNIFLRHTKIKKSHETSPELRMEQGATIHLNSIQINDAYKENRNRNRLQGKNICIFDDYLTHGNSFEALRNMLRKAGANKIIFMSLGRFNRDYIYQNYSIDGDVFSEKGFRFELIDKKIMSGKYNYTARSELRELANIFDV